MNLKQKYILYPLAVLAFLLLSYLFLVSVATSVKNLGGSIIILPSQELYVNENQLNHTDLSQLPVEAQIRRIFGEDSPTALAIAKAESGLNCSAVSSTFDYGIFQLHFQPIFDCTWNIFKAKELFDQRGWQPWSVYNSKAYLKYLN